MRSRRTALVTGVSRPNGIAAAVARRLAAAGHDLTLSGFAAYDAEIYGSTDRTGELVGELRATGARVDYLAADLADPAEPGRLVAAAIETHGRLDTLVAVHAHSTQTPLDTVTATEIDRHLHANVRGTLLLVQAYAAAYTGGRPLGDDGGRVVLFSSGQRLGAMPGELAYIASKGAIEALTLSLSDALADRGVTVNAVNPGPVDTGYLSGADFEQVRRAFPAGRWGTPDGTARLVGWLCSPDAGWITGQVIDSEGGFRRG